MDANGIKPGPFPNGQERIGTISRLEKGYGFIESGGHSMMFGFVDVVGWKRKADPSRLGIVVGKKVIFIAHNWGARQVKTDGE